MAVLALAALVPAAAARGEVRIVEDEVVFSVRAPGAKNVFLVGDFNNWNPTLEKMEEADDVFQVRLFLLAGTYRYKFVVDGKWIPDPDNPPQDAARGSLLVLEQRAGMLAFGTGEKAEEKTGEVLKPSVRYAGAFYLDDGDTGSNQALDVWVSHSSRNIEANVDFKTLGDTWDVSPLRAEILFDRGFIDLKRGSAVFKAFENDSIWDSSDPFVVFGRAGVYGYNAGFERRGASIEVPLVLNMTLRALYSDRIGERPGPPLVVESVAFDDFTASQTPDTLVYRYTPVNEDEDTWGVELAGDAGSVEFGYVMRENNGFHPGTLAGVAKTGSSFATEVCTTREFWNADVLWARWGFFQGLSAVAGVGWADAEIRSSARSTAAVDSLGDLTMGQTAEAFDRNIPLQKSSRWTGGLEFQNPSLRGTAVYSRSEYEFSTGVYAPSRAVVEEVTAGASHEEDRWNAEGSIWYVTQDYGETPPEFHAWTPQRNFWLDGRDILTVARMTAFDHEKSTGIEASYRWGRRVLSNLAAPKDTGKVALAAAGSLTSRGFLEAIEYGSLRLGVDVMLPRRLFVQWDSRMAWYHKAAWGLEDTFFSTYLEGGYRNAWTEVSLGFGLDPVVLDPVINQYADIGRDESLRRAIPAGLGRSGALALGKGLRDRETALQNYRVVKLEVIVLF